MGENVSEWCGGLEIGDITCQNDTIGGREG